MVRYGNAITPEQTSVPKKVFAVMGALDGLSGVMQIFASTYLGGALIILLSQVRSSHHSPLAQGARSVHSIRLMEEFPFTRVIHEWQASLLEHSMTRAP